MALIQKELDAIKRHVSWMYLIELWVVEINVPPALGFFAPVSSFPPFLYLSTVRG